VTLALSSLAVGAGGVGALDVAAGRALFDHAWVFAPSSLHGQSGLGPLYDARACGSCHANAGPGRIVARLGDARGEPDPVYGEQIQDSAAPGVAPEAVVSLGWKDVAGARTATARLMDLGYGPLAPTTHVSLRRAPGLDGVGLLDAVTDEEILSRSDPDDRDGDGISGRPAWLVDGKGGRSLGRWGWKASQPTLAAQAAVALRRDIGVSTSDYPEAWGDCTPAQRACRQGAAAMRGRAEASDEARDLIVAYLRSLRAPAGKGADGAGEAVFTRAGCAACHATLTTREGAPVRAYTDLLLHDMGPGLDDGVGEGSAAPAEWRTAPLWSLRAELDAGGLLHDGRARSITEAVAWHGGEAARSRARFMALSARDRAALETFLLGH
jgi:CxxC motif-containing protein (DUF1111 family)